MKTINGRIIAEQIFLAAVERVLPSRLIPEVLYIKNNCLLAGNSCIPLDGIENIYVIGAGKASAAMAYEMEKIPGLHIAEGHIVVKYGHSCRLKNIKVTEAGHPVPDSNGFRAAEKILEIADKAGKNDLVICLISGGGSALLPDFPDGSSPEEIMQLNDHLIKSGASINEINSVRKHLSSVKGGQLTRIVYPARLISLILSDVPGDPPDMIASGPTTPDTTTFQQASDVLARFNLQSSVPAGIRQHLEKGIKGLIPETPKAGDPVFDKTANILIGNNTIALEAAKLKALEYNINAIIISDQLQGDVSTVADYLVETALNFQRDKNETKPVCLLFGGETTVRMNGNGQGGRNQHLALLTSFLLQKHPLITILAAGTDGNDGPTGAAGAVVDSDTIPDALLRKADPEKFLNNFDSYNFFRKTSGHIITGSTMTNVMDIIVVLIW